MHGSGGQSNFGQLLRYPLYARILLRWPPLTSMPPSLSTDTSSLVVKLTYYCVEELSTYVLLNFWSINPPTGQLHTADEVPTPPKMPYMKSKMKFGFTDRE